MGAIGVILGVRGDRDIEKLQDAVQEHVVRWLERSFDGGPYRGHRTYLDFAREDRESGPSATALRWVFPDFGGNCTRSMYLWKHWMRLAIAVQWDELASLARQHGYELNGERWPLEVARTDSFLELRDELWMIMDDVIHCDGGGLDVKDLSPEERALVEAARELCACAPCRMLRKIS
jgi:hypothetical protein